MSNDLPFECQCGATKGIIRDVSPKRCNHMVCYCADCQAYAHYLGRPDDLLDANGGTRIAQIRPGTLEISQGQESVTCMRFSPKGPVRWYTACCKTPLGNTLTSAKIPFLAVPYSGMTRGPEFESALGPVKATVYGQDAYGDTSGLNIGTKPSPGNYLSAAKIVIGSRISGDYKRSPFFDPATGQPRVAPKVLSREERGEAQKARDAYKAAAG